MKRVNCKDARIIQGGEPVAISTTTAIEALHAMRRCAESGAYKHYMEDHASFVSAAIHELEKAVAYE